MTLRAPVRARSNPPTDCFKNVRGFVRQLPECAVDLLPSGAGRRTKSVRPFSTVPVRSQLRMALALATLVLVFALVPGCQHVGTFAVDEVFDLSFRLTDVAGQPTNTFLFGEDVVFTYRLRNRTGRLLQFFLPDTGPFVTFAVYRDGELVGTSEDGLNFAPVLVDSTLPPGAELVRAFGWLLNPRHQPLPPGRYTAEARPRVNFRNAPTPGRQRLAFEVVCPEGETCDALPPVRITDLPPDSLQLDPFQLQVVRVSGDTLFVEVGHGGGCREHTYALFMSPAAFLESAPVQANLFLRHNAHDDPCDAWLQPTLAFDLRPVAALYQQSYGGLDEIILNVYDYFEEAPGRYVSVSYFPE